MKTLIWSVAWGDYSFMLQGLVDSIKRSGITHDIMTFTDRPLVNTISQELDKNIEQDFKQYWKFHYLNKLKSLNYDLFVFIDSDHYFVRKPHLDFSDIIGNDPWHSFLESPINSVETKRGDWWGIPNDKMVELYRNFGVDQNIVFNSNGGYWICKRDFIEHAKDTIFLFKDYQRGLGYDLPEEVGISIMSHLFSKDYSKRWHMFYKKYWASEWTGALKDKLPDGSQWLFQEYMTHKQEYLNPDLVHAMRSKSALVNMGKTILQL
ncbi:hypothetical protein EB001_17670 [bacterium]|nr:hypothetical protein [bacterium]